MIDLRPQADRIQTTGVSPQAKYNRIHRDMINRRERGRAAMYASAVAMIKLERGCADCGYDEDPVALDFDHIGGTKLSAVSRMLNQAIDRILDEIEKCEVVCANCHRIRTHARRAGSVQREVA
jgi:hypothetical protein